jgi:RNA polymerase sigma-70 factor (ECF subfamily)
LHDPIEIKKFVKGNKRVFDKIYNAYAPNMYSHCLRMARNEDDAKDMLQESFIKVYTNRKQFDLTQSLGGWIRKIVINTSLNFIKKNYKINFESEEILDHQIVYTGEDEEPKISKEQLNRALSKLPEGYRIVFDLYIIEGLTHPEIAAYLDVSVNTSKTQLFKARKMLKAELNGIGKEEKIANVS